MTPKPNDSPPVFPRLLQTLESLENAGVTHIPKVRRAATKPRPAAAAPSLTVAVPSISATAGPSLPTVSAAAKSLFNPTADADSELVPAAERAALLEIIRQEVAGCTRCAELASTRTQTVFGVGNPNARLMFIGEAPGADEDRQGEPFVGRAGQLLTRIIEACRMSRGEVYIGNVLKCRPPGNRTPEPDEVEHCRGYLERQLAIIRPEYICCLGLVASQALLKTTNTMGRLRGKFFDFRGIPVLCTYHPAYLLRNPSAKREVWEDMKMLMARMGVTL